MLNVLASCFSVRGMQSCLGIQAAHPIAKASIFRHAILLHLDAAYNLARWLMGDPLEADGVIESACVQAFHHFTAIREDDMKIRLLQVVRNTAHVKIQAKMAADEVFDDSHPDHDSKAAIPATVTGRNRIAWITNDAARLRAAVAALPLDLRECLVLRDLEHLSCKEIASITANSTSMVRTKLYRARRCILASLAEDTVSKATMFPDHYVERTKRPVPPSAVRCL